jgi:sec-independent protein translocase protein TatC
MTPTEVDSTPKNLDPEIKSDEIPDDVEMGFFDHLEELRQRLFYSLIAVFFGCIGCFIFVKPLVSFLEIPANGIRFAEITPGGFFYTSFKVAGYSGLILASPIILYQIIQFILPGLTRKERKLILPVVIGSTFLFLLGLVFAYYTLIPVALKFFVSYAQDIVEQYWSINEYFGTVLSLLFYTGLTFQVPVIQLLLGSLGIVSSQKMFSAWRYVILGAAILGAVITPSTDPFTQSLLGGAVLALYFGGIGLVKLTGN